MNKQTRLVMSFLFIVVIILAAAITHFYLSVPDNTDTKNSQTEIVQRFAADGSGDYIFTDSSGKYGAADAENRVMIAPEWDELRFAPGGRCIAGRKISGTLLYGCVDNDGNTVVPLIYTQIEKLSPGNKTFFTAQSADGGLVLYDQSFRPCFRRTWSSCTVNGGDIVLADGGGKYTFTTGKEGLIFNGATFSGKAGGCPYTVDVTSKVMLSKLTVSMIEDMTAITEKYIEYAFSGDDELLAGITKGSRAGFTALFPDDHRLLSKRLVGISDVHIYSVKGKDDTPCFETSFKAETEITYTDENGERRTLRDKYKAAVGFSGSSENDLKALSGGFEKDAPDYPEPEEKTEAPQDQTPAAHTTAGNGRTENRNV